MITPLLEVTVWDIIVVFLVAFLFGFLFGMIFFFFAGGNIVKFLGKVLR